MYTEFTKKKVFGHLTLAAATAAARELTIFSSHDGGVPEMQLKLLVNLFKNSDSDASIQVPQHSIENELARKRDYGKSKVPLSS